MSIRRCGSRDSLRPTLNLGEKRGEERPGGGAGGAVTGHDFRFERGQLFGDGPGRAEAVEQAVAEVLEALVVARRHRRAFIGERAVGDGFEQEPGVAKVNPDLLLELLQRLRQRRSLRLSYEPAFSWMYSQA